MHPLNQNQYNGYQAPVGSPTNGENGGGEQQQEAAKYSDINTILDQILNITDQSLDEAQVSNTFCMID
jgi:hypothetical protein